MIIKLEGVPTTGLDSQEGRRTSSPSGRQNARNTLHDARRSRSGKAIVRNRRRKGCRERMKGLLPGTPSPREQRFRNGLQALSRHDLCSLSGASSNGGDPSHGPNAGAAQQCR